MTHRRLFLWILLGSTLLLAGVWGFSTVRSSSLEFRPFGGRILRCMLYPGTVDLSIGQWFRVRPEIWSCVVIDDPSHLRHLRKTYGVMGRFALMTENRPAELPVHVLRFPVWLPNLLLMAGAYGVMRRMERKKDAEQALAGDAEKP